IDWYRCRWEIETFFNVLKNGCRVEALQLGSVAKLELALAVYMVVAWRLARLVRLGRTHPDLSASALLTEAEWKGAYILAKKKPPTQPPTIREVIRQIAMLGGFLGRKCDGQPGVKSLWLGFARVRDFVQGVEHMRLLQDNGAMNMGQAQAARQLGMAQLHFAWAEALEQIESARQGVRMGHRARHRAMHHLQWQRHRHCRLRCGAPMGLDAARQGHQPRRHPALELAGAQA
ncbi:IS4 family transposase, partial [Verminephrobacter eiseniae]|uniref:IS4 family transposase n=1 Tax=Verminephrobacter eiseniae TaxID=364317 RepID=UPI002243457E